MVELRHPFLQAVDRRVSDQGGLDWGATMVAGALSKPASNASLGSTGGEGSYEHLVQAKKMEATMNTMGGDMRKYLAAEKQKVSQCA